MLNCQITRQNVNPHFVEDNSSINSHIEKFYCQSQFSLDLLQPWIFDFCSSDKQLVCTFISWIERQTFKNLESTKREWQCTLIKEAVKSLGLTNRWTIKTYLYTVVLTSVIFFSPKWNNNFVPSGSFAFMRYLLHPKPGYLSGKYIPLPYPSSIISDILYILLVWIQLWD